MSDAKFAFQIISGFVGCHHAGLKRHILSADPPMNTLRALMDIQDISDAVSGAVVEIHSILPERHARKNIQISTAHSFLKNSRSKRKMSFKDKCVCFFLLGSKSAKRNCSRYICGSFHVVPARIGETQSIWFKQNVGFFGGLVMHDCAVFTVCYDGIKAVLDKSILFTPVFFKLRGRIKLGNIARCNILLKPADKTAHRNAILNMRFTDVILLRFVLNSLHVLDRAFFHHYCGILRHTGQQSVINRCRVDFYHIAVHATHIFVNLIIWPEFYSERIKVFSD